MRANRNGTGDIHAPTLWPRLVLWLIPVALLFATRPFRGIYHDAHLYSVQALKRLNEELLQADIFFKYGNQDDFSAFTRVYAPLIDTLGLNMANILLYVSGLAIWFAALAYLILFLFEARRARLLAFLGALALTPAYGIGILSYGEGFVTPRVFSEALGIVSLCTALQRRWLFTAFLLIAATVLHPLVGLVLMAVIIWLLIERVSLYVALCLLGLLALAGLGLGGVEPFTWVWEQMDAQWYALVATENPIVFATDWGVNGLANSLLKAVVLIIILRKDTGPRFRLARAALVVPVILLALSVVFADLLGNRLFIGLQLWRVLFLFALLSNVMAFHAVQCVQDGRGRQLLLLALVVNLLEMAFNMTALISALLGLVAGAALLLEERRGNSLPLALRLLASLPTLLLLLAFSSVVVQRLVSAPPETLMIVSKTVLCILAIWLVLASHSVSAGAVALVSVAVILVFGSIDIRSPWTRFAETAHPPPSELRAMLENKTVYWDNGIQLMWFTMRRPQFYSCRQKGGMVFYREQAVEIIRRGKILSALNTQGFPSDPTSHCPPKQTPGATSPSGRTTFETVCRKLPELDLIVLTSRLPGLYRDVWIAPVTADIALPDGSFRYARIPFFFYHCADFRG